MDETQKINAQLREDINNAIRTFNSDGRYHLILTTSAMQENVLFSVEGYDISNDILELLNSTEK
jgi:Skp family chaperone for outer membrane proteins